MITVKTFVTAWITGNSVADVATTVGLTSAATSARATLLRKAGVNLPKFRRGKATPAEVDVTGLNDLIAQNLEG